MSLFSRLPAKMSVRPSPLKSPEARKSGGVAGNNDSFSETKLDEFLTGRNATLDVPPPGAGLVTVMDAVEAVAISVERMVAVSCPWFTNVVARGLPFQLTVE